MSLDAVRVFRLAQGAVVRLPEPVTRGLFSLAADGAWLARVGGIRQLEANLARIRPDLGRRALRRVSRQNLRAYLRYYREAFQLPGMSAEQVAARVRVTGDGPLRAEFEAGRSVVAALSHSGNWDLAGAWGEQDLAHVVTVAEHLEPEEIFQGFLDFRTGLGMTIIPLEKGGSVFRDLLRHARAEAAIIPLLADRDLSRTGIEVDLLGHRARVAPGPAALSLAAGRALHATMVRHERLRGARRRAAGTPWGLVIEFSPRLDRGREDTVEQLTQRWVDWLADAIRRHPAQWHMLQKVFLEDLDADRLARSAAGPAPMAEPAAAGPAPTAEPAGAGPAPTAEPAAAGPAPTAEPASVPTAAPAARDPR
ncbi:phosphatidylinositol mannoside acyltransferase [Georgenia sp. SYP-B2076]|uniref:phosphatidylinositol mannoside acyltransferase n=1 Tax=Georgenia sp. SYP-B2076 TaxID=2495881 RepID=UPI000F8EB9CC|nr:phosphatidylinositol mannoside acyltransferase [Georgenia sp. SYP-B2076]